jgi:hypothetical protein
MFTRRCWDVTTTNSGGSFSYNLPPDSTTNATSFVDWGTPGADIGASNFVPFTLAFCPTTDLAFSDDIFNLFREYQVRQCRFTVSSLMGDSNIANVPMPEILVAPDPTTIGFPAGPSSMLAYAGCRRRVISNRSDFVFNVAPRMHVEVTGLDPVTQLPIVVPVYNNDTRDLWVMSNSVAPDFRGFAGMIRNYATNAGPSFELRFSLIVTIAARRTR